MYQKVERTLFPPEGRPVLIWDGDCGFCHYWVLRWRRMTGGQIRYAPYQEAGDAFPDIPEARFREAAQLIEPGGRVFSGAAAAYRTFTYGTRWRFLYDWYENNVLFRCLSDRAYQWIARHRSLLYNITKYLWGDNPRRPKSYWAYYLFGFLLLLLLLLLLL